MTQEIDDGQMEAGFSDEATPAAMPETVVEEQAATTAPEVIDPMKVLMDRFEKLESRTRNAEGHIGGLNHQQKVLSESVQAASKAATQQVNTAPSQAQVNEAITDQKEWNALKEDFPEWATATEKFMDAKLATIKPQAFDTSPIEKLVSERIASQTNSMREVISRVALDAAFPGWSDDVNKPEFQAWQAAQPAAIQQLGASDDVADAAKMLRMYEASKKPPEVRQEVSTRQKRFEAAVNPRGSGGMNSTSRTDIDDMEAGYSS